MDPTRRRFLHWTALSAASLTLPSSAGGSAPPDDLRQRFLDAIRGGRLRRVRSLLREEPRLLEVRDDAGLSAYALALLRRRDEVAALLRESGYVPDAHEAALAGDWERFDRATEGRPEVVRIAHPIGGTAMHAAALGGAGTEIWRVYARTGEPNEVPDPRHHVAPLQAALRVPDLPTAELTAATLLANAADPNLATGGAPPPLHLAAQRGSRELVEMLIRLGADPAAEDDRGRGAREVAEEAGHLEIVALLERPERIPRTTFSTRAAARADGRPVDVPEEIGALPIERRSEMVGKAHFDSSFVEAALREEPLLAHSVATTGEHAVEACAHTGRHEIVDLLLDHGAPCSLPTATMRGDTQRIRAFLDADPARLHERGPHDFALLWYPILGRQGPEVLELLLERGADVEEQHHLGTTALHFAALSGSLEAAELLLEHGADPNRRGRKLDSSGQTPLDCARSREQDEMARLLIGRGAVPSS